MKGTELSGDYHCVEIGRHEGLTGRFRVNSQEMRVDFFSYGERLSVDANAPIFIVLETGHTVSLFNNVQDSQTTNLAFDPNVFHQGVIANTAVVGPDRWRECDGVKTANFNVPHTMGLFRNRAKMQEFRKGNLPDDATTYIFELSVADTKLRARYGATYSMEFRSTLKLWPNFEIEFEHPKSLHDYTKYVADYVAFLSFCVSGKLYPTDITITRRDETKSRVGTGAGAYTEPHAVRYVRPDSDLEGTATWAGASPVGSIDEEELDALQGCLQQWIGRAETWKKANAMMMSCFGLRSGMDSERLISACKWLEDIPIAGAKGRLSSDDIAAIAGAAVAEAEKRGHSDSLRKRIEGALLWIKEETAEQRFSRLVEQIENRFGKGILPSTVILDLKAANRFRGHVAHSHFNPEDEKEFAAFARATAAMEAFCYLLTALDLPFAPGGLDRIRYSWYIISYKHEH